MALCGTLPLGFGDVVFHVHAWLCMHEPTKKQASMQQTCPTWHVNPCGSLGCHAPALTDGTMGSVCAASGTLSAMRTRSCVHPAVCAHRGQGVPQAVPAACPACMHWHIQQLAGQAGPCQIHAWPDGCRMHAAHSMQIAQPTVCRLQWRLCCSGLACALSASWLHKPSWL